MKPSRSALPTEARGPSWGSSRAILLKGWLASSLSLVSGVGNCTAAGWPGVLRAPGVDSGLLLLQRAGTLDRLGQGDPAVQGRVATGLQLFGR